MKILGVKMLYIVILLLMVFVSCGEHKKTSYVDMLKQAQMLADDDPDKALILLDSISKPEDMGKDNYMQYVVAKTQAKYKAKKDVSKDTLIFEAQKYFETKNNPRQAALANLYAGIMYDAKDQFDMSLKSFKLAQYYANKSGDEMLEGRSYNNIAYEYYSQLFMDSAIVYYKKALNIYEKKAGAEIFALSSIRSIGLGYYALDDIDSAYCYYQKGLELAQKDDNKFYINRFTQDLGYVYRRKGEYDKSSIYLHAALENSTNVEDSLRINLNLIQLYNLTRQKDSSKYYTDIIESKISDVKDIYMLRNIYRSISDYYKQEKNYEEALKYAELENQTNTEIRKQNVADKLLDADKKFVMDQMTKKFEEQREKLYLFIGLLVILVIAIILIFYLSNKRVKKDFVMVDAEIRRIRALSQQNTKLNNDNDD